MDVVESLLTVEEIALKLRMANSSVYNFINRGIIPAVRIGKAVRVSPRDLNTALEKMKKRAVGIAA